MALSVDCRHRSTSTRWHWQSRRDRRTAGAIFRRDLHRVLPAEIVALVGDVLERRRRIAKPILVIYLDADRGVGADERAFIALNAEGFVPHGNLGGEVPLLPLRGTR